MKIFANTKCCIKQKTKEATEIKKDANNINT